MFCGNSNIESLVSLRGCHDTNATVKKAHWMDTGSMCHIRFVPPQLIICCAQRIKKAFVVLSDAPDVIHKGATSQGGGR
jgi:hypothetical protein